MPGNPLPDFRSTSAFAQTLRRCLQALEAADKVCEKAALARRAVLRDAAEHGVRPTLLKIVARERRLDAETRDELQLYRELSSRPFNDTPLAQAAQ